MIAVAFMLLLNLFSTCGALFRRQVFKKFNYVLNHILQLLFVIVLLLLSLVYYNRLDSSTVNSD